MGKRVDLSQKTVKTTKITRKLTKYTSHSFTTTNLINGVTTESEETTAEQELEQNELKEENQNENNNEEQANDTEENSNNEEPEEKTNENHNEQPNISDNINKARSVKNTLEKLKKSEKKAKETKTLAVILKNPLTIKILLIILVVALGVVGLLLFISIITNLPGMGLLGFGGMYNARCDEMTVIFVDSDNGYEITGTQTYSMTDYVAGVVYAEVGGAHNIEVYKTFAIAARTFGLEHASEDCTIEGSARKQAFKDITNKPDEASNMIYEAVEATEGQVLLSNNELYSIQYDAFCYIDKDENYYTLSQKNQKIPVDWVEKNIGSNEYTNCPCNLNDESMNECWNGKIWKDGGHGRGMSQYGSYYLAKELDYTYDQILDYYYGDDEIKISKISFMSSIAGLEIKDTTNASYLKQPITEFLNSKGSSLDDLNAFIYNSVVEQGAGTRAGVVTAAVSMINYLYDNFNVRLPYYWGGSSGSIGLPSSFGTYSPSSTSRGGNVNYYKSFDCSGFVSWAIKNGGYNFSRISTSGFDSRFSQNSCNITDSNCVGQPGDLINSRNGHVELIIAVDQENGKYFIAHSGGPGVVMMERDMHTKNYGSTITKILFMEDFYNNSANVNHSY